MPSEPMISKEVENAMHDCFVAARTKRHMYVSVEDILQQLLGVPEVGKVLEACSVDVGELKKELAEFGAMHTPVDTGNGEVGTQPTIGFQRVIHRAILHVQSSGQKQVKALNMLVAIFGEYDSHAVFFLHRRGVSRLDILNYMAHGVGKTKVSPTSIVGLRSEILLSPKRASDSIVAGKGRPLVFISYAHVDASCLDRLLVHLKPLQKKGQVEVWSDTSIRVGDAWKKKIQEKLEEAAIAVLLISADFLASDFIAENELPPLLLAAEAKGVRILPVVLKPCGFHRDDVLSTFQSMNAPTDPLLGMDEIARERLYNAVADEIYREVKDRLSQEF